MAKPNAARKSVPAWHTPAQVILDYVTKRWEWAEPPPDDVMQALRTLDKLKNGSRR